MISATLIVIAIVLASITVTSFILNGIVLLALTFGYRQEESLLFSKTLTMSLVTADLLISLTLMPKSVYAIVDGKWLPDKMVCRFFVGADIFLGTTSLVHLAGLAGDRYLAVCHPFVHRRLSVSWARVTCILFWLSSAVIGFSSMFPVTQVETAKNFTESPVVIYGSCHVDTSYIYFGAASLLCFVIPLTAIMGFHFAIILKLRRPVTSLPTDSRAGQTLLGWKKWVCPPEVSLEVRSANTNISLNVDMTRDTNVCTQSNLQNTQSFQADHTELKTISQGSITEGYQGQTNSERKRTRSIILTSTIKRKGDRAMKTIGCLVLCFVICWAPSFLISTIYGIGWLAGPSYIFFIATWLAYVNSTINPFLYYRYHKTIRKSIRRFLRLTNT